MAQKLVLPFVAKTVILSAGYADNAPGYVRIHGYTHWGHDYGFRENGYDTYACGDGVVKYAGLDGANEKQLLGNCIVIVYPDVLCRDGVTRDLACQMCHFDKLFVTPGQRVTATTKIGEYGKTGAGNTGEHLHIQFDKDASDKYCNWMFGIAAGAHRVLRRGTQNSTVNPSEVWYRRNGQLLIGTGNTGLYANKEVDIPAVTAAVCPTCGR